VEASLEIIKYLAIINEVDFILSKIGIHHSDKK
jgi:hypothetical protein